jgi:folate-dependent tRNA-U54 methylase TrmFO/GidA
MGSDPAHFSPMNVNFGLFPALPEDAVRSGRRERHQRLAARALADLAAWREAAGRLAA